TTLELRDPHARLLMDIASHVACHLDSEARHALDVGTAPDPVERVRISRWPPSSAELAAAFAHLSRYDTFADSVESIERLRRSPLTNDEQTHVRRVLDAITTLIGIISPGASLLAIASYLEHTFHRNFLAGTLRTLFTGKHTPTAMHYVLAKAARLFMHRS